MKRALTGVAAVALLLTGCSEQPGKVEAANSPAPARTDAVAGTDIVAIPANSPKMSQIKVERVVQADMPSVEMTAPGKVEANPNRLSSVVLPVTGRIASVAVRIGDYVQQGQTLLTVESPDVDVANASLLQAQAGLTQAQSAQTKAQADLDRERDLFEHNAVAQKEVLNAQAMLTQAKAAVEQAQAGVEQARRKLAMLGVQPGKFGQTVAVRAPISGKVLEMTVVPGEFRNDLSAPLLRIADLSSVWVASDVPETAIRLVRVGESVNIDLDAYPGRPFRGRVKQIADLVDPQTRTIKVRVELDNRDGRLRPEMFAKVRHAEDPQPLPVIPSSAVIQDATRNTVWKEIAPGQFRQVAVTLGATKGDQIAVTGGLAAGDRIVTDGAMLLKSN